MRWREFVDRRDTFSSTMSIIFTLMISTSAVGTVLFAGVPYIDSVNEDKDRAYVERQFSSIVDSLIELSTSTPGDSKTIDISLNSGSLVSIDEEKDSTILMYSSESSYEFTASGLDDGDDNFEIFMQEGEITDIKFFY
jgi:hypothetical protein